MQRRRKLKKRRIIKVYLERLFRLSIVLTDADNTISYTGEAQDKSESGDITIIANGEEATSSETINVSVENDGETSDAAEADYIYVFEEGEYSYTIENFEAGDVLDLPDSPAATVNNDDWNDGEVEIQWAADGKVMTVTITGLGDNDSKLNNIDDFNSVFGEGTVSNHRVKRV